MLAQFWCESQRDLDVWVDNGGKQRRCEQCGLSFGELGLTSEPRRFVLSPEA